MIGTFSGGTLYTETKKCSLLGILNKTVAFELKHIYSCFTTYIMGQPAERKVGGGEPTEHNNFLGRAHAGTIHILGRVDNQNSLGNDC